MHAVRTLVLEIRDTLRRLSAANQQATQVVSILERMNLTSRHQNEWAVNTPPHDCEIERAINNMPPELNALSTALNNALPQLQWRIDRGIYYESDADVGDGYRDGNMHCELIGPDGSAFLHDDFTLGLFLLKPRVLYRDHAHLAPELYLTLTGPTGWRIEDGLWQDKPPGAILWNAPETGHATRVYSEPFLSIYSWTRDVRSKCRVVPRPDWSEIEQALGTMPLPTQLGKDLR